MNAKQTDVGQGYLPPKLKVFGSFSALTATGSTLLNEGSPTQRARKLP